MATNVQGPTPENAEWKALLDELEISYRQRRLSGAIVALCVFHDEKSGSMFMWPDGNLYCHGCQATLKIDEFLPAVHEGADNEEKFYEWQEELREELGDLYDQPPI